MAISGSGSDSLVVRQLPYSLEAEQAVLGAIILDSEKINELAGHITSEDFFVEKHAKIYDAAYELFIANSHIDPVTLLDMLVKKDVYSQEAGNAYIRQLAENTPSISNVLDYARIVHDKALLRRLIKVSEEISESAYSQAEDTQFILDSAEQKVFSLTQGFVTQDFSHIKDIIKDYYGVLQTITTDKNASRGIPTNYSSLDNILVGMAPSDLIIIGGRPGMGKTSFTMNIATNVAKYSKKAVAIFSLEMSKLQIVERMLSGEARIDSYKLHTGEIEEEDFNSLAQAAIALSQTDLYVDDSSGITVSGMRSKLRRIENLGLVAIDYLQLMHSDKRIDNRVLEIGDITRSLKIMAKDLNVPVLVCTQLSRSPEKRTGGNESKKPQLSDLRDSGSIEQDADVVLMLYRDGYYNEDPEAQNRAECLVAKNRHGSTGTISLGWEGRFTRFVDIEKRYEDN
ncbi:MAG: replicative DNA helicase [Ruminococcaceae bacterium]|nr:replicative DNA helicase [Oscillospiraceae bacterium]